MIIDVHTHLANKAVFSEQFLAGITEEFTQDMSAAAAINEAFIEKLMGSILSDLNCDKLIKQMDEAGIDKSVLLMTDFGYSEDSNLLEVFKANLYARDQHPNRLLLFWGSDCRREKKYVDIFDKNVKEADIRGLKLYPPCGFDLDDERMMVYYEICQSYNIPVLAHTGASNLGMYNEYDYISQINRVTEKFPKLKFVMAHLTTEGFEERVKLCKENKNVYTDVSAFQRELGKESLEAKMKIAFEEIPNKMIFGTDWPLYSMMGKQKQWVDYFKNHENISEDNKERLFYKNFMEMLEV